MATNVQGRVGSTTDSERTPGREIETIVEEFSGDPVLLLDTTAKAPADASLTPRTKSSLAKKFAKTLGFHSHSKDGASESSSLSTNPGSQLQGQQASPGAKSQIDRGVHFTSSTPSGSSITGNSPSTTVASLSKADSSSNVVNKQPVPSSNSHATYVSPFQSAQHQPSGMLTEASAFYSPTSSFNSIGSGKTQRAMSASLDDDGSQMRKSRLAPGNFHSYSGDLEQMKPKLGLLEQAPADEKSASGMLSGKSRHSSAISLKSMDGTSDSDKDLNALARANSENPWGPKRSVGSFTSGMSGRGRGDQSPRLRGAYAEIQIKDMDQQLSDARMRIVQLTAEVQSSKQAAQHHEERTAALQAQLGELKQVKDSSSQDILERLSSARSEASSLSEQLAVAKHQAEAEHKENTKLQKAMSEQGSAQQQAVDVKQKELDTQQTAARAAQEKLQQQVAQLTQQCNSYEVVLKNGDTKGQLMSLQQTLRQEIHAKIGAQTAEESAKRKVSDLQGNVQELQEALDKELAAHKDSQSTLEEAYRHRNRLEARIDELEAHMTDRAEANATDAPPHVVSKSPDQATPDGSVNSQAVAARLKEVEAREGGVKEQHARDKEDKGKEAKQQEALKLKVQELEQELMEANKRLTRIDEADKRVVGTQATKPEPSAQPAPAPATQGDPKPQTTAKDTQAAPAKQITSWRRISVDDDRVDAVISHLEGVNTTLKSLRSQGDDLEPFMGSEQDLVSELENERTNRVIAQQTANQERLQARASAAESASLRRQLNELNQQMEQDKRAATAARLQAQQTESSQGEEGVKQEAAARTYSMSSEGHAADKAALQGFAKTRDAASPVRPATDQQPSQVDEGVLTKEESEVSDASPASQQQSEAGTAPAQGGDPTEPHSSLPAGHGMEKNYTDTIESLLSELWKERLARQRAELSATESEDKLKVLVSSAEAWGGEGRRGSRGGQEEQAKAMADLDASLMQRLDEDSATNHKLMESLKATQGSSQALQERVAGVEAALRRQDTALDKLQAGAKRQMDASLRQGTTRKTLQQATQKEDKLRHTLTRVEAELAATRRLQRDQAAHAHSSARQLGDEVLEGQAQLSQQAARLAKETDRRRHLEALLDEGLQVQSQILLGLQEMVKYLQQDGHLEGQGGGMVSPPPKLDQLILLLQQSQANSSNAMSRSGTRQGVGRQSSPTRIRSAPSQKGHFSLSGTLEEGTPPVELSSSPPDTGTFSRPAWLVPGSRTEQRAAARREGEKRSSSPFGSTAARYMNPRAAAKPATEPDRMFRARSVPRGMSPQRSRVADYIRVGSPVQRGGSTQVLPATSSDMMSRERDFISAQHDPTLFSPNPQLSGNSDSTVRAKPASLLSLDNGDAASKLGSFSSYDKVQVVSSHASTAQGQQLGSGAAGNWGQQSVMISMDVPQRLAGMLGTNDRHTHED